jgi:hypothetical protein
MRSDGTSRNTDRLNLVPRAFQVSMYLLENVLHRVDAINVFANNPTGLEFLYASNHFRPEEAVILCAASLSGVGKRLAGEAAGKEVDPLIFACAPRCVDFSRGRPDVDPLSNPPSPAFGVGQN